MPNGRVFSDLTSSGGGAAGAARSNEGKMWGKWCWTRARAIATATAVISNSMSEDGVREGTGPTVSKGGIGSRDTLDLDPPARQARG